MPTFSKVFILLLVPIILILLSIGVFQVYESCFRSHITIKFDDCGPLYVNMPVFYKGYKIGYIKNVKPTEDYKSTLAKVTLYPKNPKLPENITAQVKKMDMRRDYIDLEYPDEPSDNLLKNGDTIDGEGAFDLEKTLKDLLGSGTLDPIIDSVSNFISSISDTSDQVGKFFSNANITLNDNKQNVKTTTKSISEITTKFNNSIKEDSINSMMANVNRTSCNITDASESIKKITTNADIASENIKNITANVDTATKNLDQTRSKIDCTISNINATVCNAKHITCGLYQTLKKRFAGLRMIFGKPIQNTP